MTLDFWFMFPVAILVATVAMASGVEGATFFAPIFLLGLGLPPEVAIGTGLVTEVFGFASGVISFVRRKLVDYTLARSLLMVTVPAAVAGSLISGFVDGTFLQIILGMGLIGVALSFLGAPDPKEKDTLDASIRADVGADEAAQSSVTTASGEVIEYTVCNRSEGRTIAAIGGFFMGMLSTGLGELNGYFLLRRCRVPSRVAVATGVVVVAVSALSAATVHLWRFIQVGGDTLSTVLSICIFTVPGVIIGGQLGPAVATRISHRVLERGLGFLFAAVGGLMLWSASR